MSEKELVEGTVNNVGVDTEDMRDPPMGVADFRTMRDSDLLYVDKTELIDRILSKKGIQSFLFTRPRRFGKSLNLSMLDAYFNMKYKGQAEAWFSGLGISRLRPDDPLMNSYPVVRMSLMGLVTDSTDKFCITLGTRMAKVYWEFDYLKESEAINEDQRAYFNAISGNTNDPALLSASILNLCMLLERHHNRKVVLLIDEYDNPVNNSYDRLEVQKEILGIVRGLLENGIKDNDSIAFTVVTGVMQIAKEGIFSGLNNVYVDNVFSTGFEDMFGFTAEEVQNICTESENPDAFDTAREWYDGYRFGNADIYNPWSVLEYVSRGFTAGDYWTGTGGDAIIKDIVRNTDSPMYGEILEMIDGGTIQSPLDPRITFSDAPASTRTSAYSVMVMSGYLNATPDDILKGVYNLTFPNLEVRMMFSRIIVDGMESEQNERAIELVRAFLSLDPQRMEAAIREVLLDLDFLTLSTEVAYRVLIFSIFYCRCGSHTARTECEAGDGRFDLLLSRNSGPVGDILVEFKKTDAEDDAALAAAARRGLDQAVRKDYAHRLTDPTVFGAAFHGKKVAVVRLGRRPSRR